jgi:hypothetical protein
LLCDVNSCRTLRVQCTVTTGACGYLIYCCCEEGGRECWIHVALRPAPIPPLFPPVPLVSIPIPRCALRSSWCLCALRSFWRPSSFPRVSSGAPGVSWVLQQCSVG